MEREGKGREGKRREEKGREGKQKEGEGREERSRGEIVYSLILPRANPRKMAHTKTD